MELESSLGTQLERAGWRQGSVVKQQDLGPLLIAANIAFSHDLVLFVATQSCDIAHNSTGAASIVELSLAYIVDSLNGNLAYNKNPRTLHTKIAIRTEQNDVIDEKVAELKAHEKVTIAKSHLLGLTPDEDRKLNDDHLHSYVAWLAARYSRPALPSSFNNRISRADPKGRLRAQVKKSSSELSGIYIEINPDREIEENENYSVNLLGLLSAGLQADTSHAEDSIEAISRVLESAGMDVTKAIRSEDAVSIATIRRFKRFYYDDLSFKENEPLPIEVSSTI